MKPVIDWPIGYRLTLGLWWWVFIVLPLALFGMTQEVGKGLWRVFWDDLCGSEAWRLMGLGLLAVVLGRPKPGPNAAQRMVGKYSDSA